MLYKSLDGITLESSYIPVTNWRVLGRDTLPTSRMPIETMRANRCVKFSSGGGIPPTFSHLNLRDLAVKVRIAMKRS